MNDAIDSLVLIPSPRCNMQCAHCCRNAGPQRHEIITDAVLRRFRYIADESCDVTISGGEPFILRQSTWERIFDALPYAGLNSLYIATNGAWAQSARKRLWFHSWWISHAQNVMHEYADHISVELSNDQYHDDHADIVRAWKTLKSEAEQGFVDNLAHFDEDSLSEYGYFTPYTEDGVLLSERNGYIHNIKPIGRAHDWCADSDQMDQCGIEVLDGDDDELEYRHTITVWPDGRVSACCDGGACIGNVLTMSLDDIFENHNRFFDKMLDDYRWKQGYHSVTQEACTECMRIGRQLFGTTFRTTKGAS